jgi:tetratricopeptide (TPR) repeat protein
MDALKRPGAQKRNLARCQALADAGQFCNYMGRYAEAREPLEESLSIARELGDRRRIARVLQPLSLAYLGEHDFATAHRYAAEALELANELGEKREVAAALNGLAQLHRLEGNLDEAEPLYEQLLALMRELDDRESIAIALLNLAMVAVERKDALLARERLIGAMGIANELGSRTASQSLLEVAAGLAVLGEEANRAARFYGAAEEHAAQTGLHRDPADEAFLRPLIARAQRALGDEAFGADEAAGRALGYGQAMAELREWLLSGARG